MEPKFQLEFPGQQVQKTDLELIGTESALADDRVFAELLRMTPFPTDAPATKGILTYRHASSGVESLVTPNGADGKVRIAQFRAFVSSRTLVYVSPKDNWRDIRSALSVISTDTTGHHLVTVAANSSGDPRWDLIYATVTVDADDTTTSRKVKDPTTKVVSSETVSVTKSTTVAIGITTGTAAPGASWPALPADSGGNYNIPLAYILVPDGHSSTSTVTCQQIAIVAPCLALSESTGTTSLRPASSNSEPAVGAIAAWADAGPGGRTDYYVPSSMVGGRSLFCCFNLMHASDPTQWSHQTGSIVDDSIDWRFRYFRWSISASGNVSDLFPHERGGSSFSGSFITGVPAPGVSAADGMGQSFFDNHGLGYTTEGGTILLVSNANLSQVDAGSTGVHLYVDPITGFMKIDVGGFPQVRLFVWLDSTAPFENSASLPD